MHGFRDLADQALILAKQGLHDNAWDAASESLGIYPSNFVLISQLTKHSQEWLSRSHNLAKANELLRVSLHKTGENRDIFHLLPSISRIRANMAQAHSNGISPRNQTGRKRVPKRNPDSKTETKIGILSCLWQRHALTRIFLDHLQILRESMPSHIKIVPIIIGSEGSLSGNPSRERGFIYAEHPNKPLAAKWEFGLQITREVDVDAIVIIGSDDFVSPDLFILYHKLLSEGVSMAGLIDCYFASLQKDSRMIYWKGYGGSAQSYGQPWRLGETIGLGRLFSRRLLEELDYSLWGGSTADRGLDSISAIRLSTAGYLPILYQDKRTMNTNEIEFAQLGVSMEASQVFAIDIKWRTHNVTPFADYERSKSAIRRIDFSWRLIEERLGHETAKSLQLLSQQ